jgi:hypothetical protein
MKTQREKKLEVALLKEKLERISGKKILFREDEMTGEKIYVRLTTNLYLIDDEANLKKPIAEVDMVAYAKKGNLFIADAKDVSQNQGLFKKFHPAAKPKEGKVMLDNDWYQIIPMEK